MAAHFVRLHSASHRVKRAMVSNPYKALYLLQKSKERYDLTDDGIEVARMVEDLIRNPPTEIGRIENIRFIRG